MEIRPYRAERLAALTVLTLLAACATRGEPAPSVQHTSISRPLAADPALADPLVGTTPTEWTTEEWLNAPPKRLAELRGKVVLVRWFMGTSCPMCSATAASLRALDHDYGPRGLAVIGMYHHKDEEPLTRAKVESYVNDFGFTFPVAIDRDWKTLKAWWLDAKERDYTSVSFLLDKHGRVRGVHQGGRYAPGEPAYEAIRRAVEKLLDEG